MTALALAPDPTPQDPSIEGQLAHHYQQVELAARDMLTHAIAAGQLLHDAKLTVDHGAWSTWLEENFPGSHRTANQWMQLAEARRDTPELFEQLPDRTLTTAIRAIAGTSSVDTSPKPTTVPTDDTDALETHSLTIDQLQTLVASFGGTSTTDRIRRWIERQTEPKITICPHCNALIIHAIINGQPITADRYEWQPRTVCTKCLQTRHAHPGQPVSCPHCNSTGYTGQAHRPPGQMLAMDMAWSDTPNLRIIGERTDRREGEALHPLHQCAAQRQEAA